MTPQDLKELADQGHWSEPLVGILLALLFLYGVCRIGQWFEGY